MPFDYEPEAPPPAKWLQFLHELWPDDLESVEALQEFLGSSGGCLCFVAQTVASLTELQALGGRYTFGELADLFVDVAFRFACQDKRQGANFVEALAGQC